MSTVAVRGGSPTRKAGERLKVGGGTFIDWWRSRAQPRVGRCNIQFRGCIEFVSDAHENHVSERAQRVKYSTNCTFQSSIINYRTFTSYNFYFFVLLFIWSYSQKIEMHNNECVKNN